MPARKKVSTTVYITEEQNEMLKLLSQQTKVPAAEYIRQGIDVILSKNQVHIQSQLSFLDQINDEEN